MCAIGELAVALVVLEGLDIETHIEFRLGCLGAASALPFTDVEEEASRHDSGDPAGDES